MSSENWETYSDADASLSAGGSDAHIRMQPSIPEPSAVAGYYARRDPLLPSCIPTGAGLGMTATMLKRPISGFAYGSNNSTHGGSHVMGPPPPPLSTASKMKMMNGGSSGINKHNAGVLVGSGCENIRVEGSDVGSWSTENEVEAADGGVETGGGEDLDVEVF